VTWMVPRTVAEAVELKAECPDATLVAGGTFPPAMLVALDAWVEALSVRGLRGIPVADLILGHYQTALEEDELITRVLVPRGRHHVTYRKLRTRSREDRPSVAVGGNLCRCGCYVKIIDAVQEVGS
jgi:CO/xanthine dehydrogenase FAD-binding subunit